MDMDRKERYRQVFLSFKELCAQGKQPCSFARYCIGQGVDARLMRSVLRGEFHNLRDIPGYSLCEKSRLYSTIYNDFKDLCARGKQPGTFKSYCAGFGVKIAPMHSYLKYHKLRVLGLPGYTPPPGVGTSGGQSIPFEDVLFQEAGFLPAGESCAITVRVDGRVTVSFPGDTDVAVIARFIRKIGKGAANVES